MITRLEQQRIKHMSGILPVVFYVHTENTAWKGWELKLTPIEKEMKLEDDKEYIIQMPCFRSVNHYRRMRKAYDEGGILQLREYCNKIESLIKSGTNVLSE